MHYPPDITIPGRLKTFRKCGRTVANGCCHCRQLPISSLDFAHWRSPERGRHGERSKPGGSPGASAGASFEVGPPPGADAIADALHRHS
jgi:hypothetical protein